MNCMYHKARESVYLDHFISALPSFSIGLLLEQAGKPSEYQGLEAPNGIDH